MKGKWFYYWKKVQGRIDASDYFFIKEENSYIYENENSHLRGRCEDWACKVNGSGSNNGFEYGFDDIDSPPQEWIDKKIKSIELEIEEKNEFLNFIKTLKK